MESLEKELGTRGPEDRAVVSDATPRPTVDEFGRRVYIHESGPTDTRWVVVGAVALAAGATVFALRKGLSSLTTGLGDFITNLTNLLSELTNELHNPSAGEYHDPGFGLPTIAHQNINYGGASGAGAIENLIDPGSIGLPDNMTNCYCILLGEKWIVVDEYYNFYVPKDVYASTTEISVEDGEFTTQVTAPTLESTNYVRIPVNSDKWHDLIDKINRDHELDHGGGLFESVWSMNLDFMLNLKSGVYSVNTSAAQDIKISVPYPEGNGVFSNEKVTVTLIPVNLSDTPVGQNWTLRLLYDTLVVGPSTAINEGTLNDTIIHNMRAKARHTIVLWKGERSGRRLFIMTGSVINARRQIPNLLKTHSNANWTNANNIKLGLFSAFGLANGTMDQVYNLFSGYAQLSPYGLGYTEPSTSDMVSLPGQFVDGHWDSIEVGDFVRYVLNIGASPSVFIMDSSSYASVRSALGRCRSVIGVNDDGSLYFDKSASLQTYRDGENSKLPMITAGYQN